MAAPRVLSALGLAIVIYVNFSSCPSADALSFLDIAASVTERVVPRPRPQAVPEFILLAEQANKNKLTSRRPPGSVPDFVLIAESVHNSGGDVDIPIAPEMQHTTSLLEAEDLSSTAMPPVSSRAPDVINISDFTRPIHVTQTISETEETSPSPEKEENNKDEDFDEDKIYFEEWEKVIGDPR